MESYPTKESLASNWSHILFSLTPLGKFILAMLWYFPHAYISSQQINLPILKRRIYQFVLKTISFKDNQTHIVFRLILAELKFFVGKMLMPNFIHWERLNWKTFGRRWWKLEKFDFQNCTALPTQLNQKSKTTVANLLKPCLATSN